MKNLMVSVVIPMYNREETIVGCLDSVCNQTFKNIEVIVVDDCSTDHSVRLVENYKDERVRLIKLDKKSGAQVARNKGISESKADWIAFNDSDDLWMVDKLAVQIAELSNAGFNKNTVVHSNCFCLDLLNDNRTWEWKLPQTLGMCYELLLKRPAPMFQAILTSKDALLEIDMLDENVPSYQEWDTSIRLAKNCQFIHIEKPLFTYVFHKGETISKDHKRDVEGYLYILNKFEDELKINNMYESHVRQLSKRAASFSLFCEADEIISKLDD
jgi:glycosyltransferase involved in cell wall biosynthesis